MTRHHPVPRRLLVIDARSAGQCARAVARLSRGSGVLMTRDAPRLPVRLRLTARMRGLRLIHESAGEASRVHSSREILRARLRGTPLLLLSPLFVTASHPGWRPLPRMRAAALVRLCRAKVIALGGMTEKRFCRIERLGFQGWAGISAWIRT